jgi:simple sugar transport system permease protein
VFLSYRIEKKSYTPTFWDNILLPGCALLAMLVISGIMLVLLGYPVFEVLFTFFISPLTNLYDFSEVVMKASILVVIALGLAVGFRANVWNIGAEGQFVMGGIAGSLVALYFYEQEGFYILPLMMLSGAIGGALWAMIPAFLKNRFNTNEILTSLMLVYIAEQLLNYLTYGPLKDPDGLNFPQTVYFSESAIYPYLLEGTRLSITPVITLLLVPLVYLLITKSHLGFQLRVSGYSAAAAKYAGFSAKKMVWISFILCGAFAGFAGISEVSANISQLIPDISPGYGFTAIIVAFLGRLHPVGIIFAGFFMALIYIGAESAQISLGLPVSIGNVFQGLVLFCLLASEFMLRYQIKRR